MPARTATVRVWVKLSPVEMNTTEMATASGAVGPEIWVLVPPKTAAKKPTAMAPYSPAMAPRPDATPNASDSGRATTAAVMPPNASSRKLLRL